MADASSSTLSRLGAARLTAMASIVLALAIVLGGTLHAAAMLALHPDAPGQAYGILVGLGLLLTLLTLRLLGKVARVPM